VDRLARAGLITAIAENGRKRIQANPAAPIFHELRAIIEKTAGVAAQIRSAVESAGAGVRVAILYGSVAKGAETAASDIDVLLVGDDLTQEVAFAMFADTERRLGRRINPTVYTSEELARRRRDRSPFLTKVLAGPHMIVVGSDDELAA
jgi:predicted nucleotidyltransferase